MIWKPLYSISELTALFRLHRNSVVRLLAASGIEFTRAGNRRYVALSEIQKKLPEVWESVWLVERED